MTQTLLEILREFGAEVTLLLMFVAMLWYNMRAERHERTEIRSYHKDLLSNHFETVGKNVSELVEVEREQTAGFDRLRDNLVLLVAELRKGNCR